MHDFGTIILQKKCTYQTADAQYFQNIWAKIDGMDIVVYGDIRKALAQPLQGLCMICYRNFDAGKNVKNVCGQP